MQGQLLLLVTDHGFINEYDHIWQILSDIDGDGDFLDANFRWSSHSEMQKDRVEGATRKHEEHHSETLKSSHTPTIPDQPIVSHPDVE